MPQLAHLRQKIRSVQKTKKITHALRLISMSFYNKLEKTKMPLDAYVDGLKVMFEQLLAHGDGWVNPVLAPRDLFDKRPLFIIVSTAKGWCGSLNSNLFRHIEQALFLEENQEASFIIIGTKAINHFKSMQLLKRYKNARLVASYGEVSSHNLFALADELVEKTVFGPFIYSSVSFFSNEARSFFVQRTSKTTVLPIAFNLANRLNEEDRDDEILWEQSKQEVLDFVAGRYLRGQFVRF